MNVRIYQAGHEGAAAEIYPNGIPGANRPIRHLLHMLALDQYLNALDKMVKTGIEQFPARKKKRCHATPYHLNIRTEAACDSGCHPLPVRYAARPASGGRSVGPNPTFALIFT